MARRTRSLPRRAAMGEKQGGGVVHSACAGDRRVLPAPPPYPPPCCARGRDSVAHLHFPCILQGERRDDGHPSDLTAALAPRSVAVIGASTNPNKIGGRPIAYMTRFGFRGAIYPINPNAPEVQGHKSYADLASLPEAPDLVVVAVPGDAASARSRPARRAASRSRW